MDKKEVVAMLFKRIDVRGLIVEDLLDAVLEPALDKLVKDTSTPFDDMAKQAVYPVLKQELIKALDAILAKAKE